MLTLALAVTSHARVAIFETYDPVPNCAFALTCRRSTYMSAHAHVDYLAETLFSSARVRSVSVMCTNFTSCFVFRLRMIDTVVRLVTAIADTHVSTNANATLTQ